MTYHLNDLEPETVKDIKFALGVHGGKMKIVINGKVVTLKGFRLVETHFDTRKVPAIEKGEVVATPGVSESGTPQPSEKSEG